MRVLVTGHLGKVGHHVAEDLERTGHRVIGFDIVEGADLLDAAAVNQAAVRCDAIVHLGALAHDTAGTPEQIMAVNVLGTWHVLLSRRGQLGRTGGPLLYWSGLRHRRRGGTA